MYSALLSAQMQDVPQQPAGKRSPDGFAVGHFGNQTGVRRSEIQEHVVEQIFNGIVMDEITEWNVIMFRFRIRTEDYVQTRKSGKSFINTGYLIQVNIILQACYGHIYTGGSRIWFLLLSHKA